MDVNPILLEVFRRRFASIAEEMGSTLMRTGYSPNIKERRDFSCAVFDAAGNMLAQAAHIPVHLGSMPLSVQAALAAGPLRPGDMVALNDPFRGGTHLPDITLVAPAFVPGADAPAFLVANRAHHADVGGMSPGSMPLSSSIHQEGLIIPPLRLVKEGRADPDLMALLLANVRTPDERRGDFAAQIMANRTGQARLDELLAGHGEESCAAHAAALLDHAEALTRASLRDLPDGVWSFTDYLDDDGQGARDIPIRLRLEKSGDALRLDFTGSAPQVRGGVNAVRAITLSAALYVLRSLAAAQGRDIPANAGCLRPVEVLTTPGTVVDALPPAAVAGGNVETSQRIVDVILGALAQAAPHLVPAASQGTMNNLAIGGLDPRTGAPFAYYETLAGGAGATALRAGASAVHTHMTNTLNTPVEALEYAYPLLCTECSIRRGSGGAGRRPGGDGLVRALTLLAEAEVTVLSERRTRGPWGLAGGRPGAPGRNSVTRGGVTQEMPGKFSVRLAPGDSLRIETPGGGGYGEE
ncbi:MAG: hydantoinase B/oxoprolinase family protein [Thermodesulfobacteriota bacterium]